jgi:hypothetical protein
MRISAQTMYRRTTPTPGYTPLLCSGSKSKREQEEYQERLVEENCGNLFALRSVATV